MLAATNRLKILVVDDNTDAAQMLAMYLEALGHQVLVELDSVEALACALREHPDVCLLDIGLPNMSGTELARLMRACPETAQALLVAITGYSQRHDREQAINAGFDHYFVKPLQTDQLVALLHSRAARTPS